MNNPFVLTFALTAFCGAAVTNTGASQAANEVCGDCKPEVEMTFRERTKAEREKFQIEMKQNSKRPWDGMDLGFRRPATTERGPASDAPSSVK